MRISAYILIMSLFFSSCNHKELCYHHPHTAKVRINVDWSEFKKETPTGMTVMIYPQAGGTAIRQLSNTTTHTIVDLEAGLYNTIVYNQSSTEYSSVTFVEMKDFSTAEVKVNNASSRWYACRTEGEKLALQPEWIGTDFQTDALVTPEMVKTTSNELMADLSQQHRLYTEYVIATHVPQNIIHTIYVKVHLKGVYNLRSARASLDGLAEGYKFAKARTTDLRVTHLLENWHLTFNDNDPTEGYITTQITCMGLPYGHRASAEENEFILSLLLVDDKTIVDIPFKVGDKLQKRYDKEGKYTLELDLELRVDDPLPDVKPSGSGNGGFNARVDDWGDEHKIDIGV